MTLQRKHFVIKRGGNGEQKKKQIGVEVVLRVIVARRTSLVQNLEN